MNGLILWEGSSPINGEEIVCIATFKSANRKTGNMIQTWILLKNESPSLAAKAGRDRAICGDCVHRRHTGGACYVNTHEAPTQVWKSYQMGKYENLNLDKHSGLFKGRRLRIGSYGDPAVVPYEVWQSLLEHAKSHTGYTHQAHEPWFDERIADICMISVETEEQAEEYNRKGWRTFRTLTEHGAVIPKLEIACPYESNNLQCYDCMLCNGANRRRSIAIKSHGTTKSRFENIYEMLKGESQLIAANV
jgi:hypothetical protein